MVTREYVACTTCDESYRARYGHGTQYPQKASFYCTKCGEKLTIGFDKNLSLIVENLKLIAEDLTLKTINLHPEVIIDPSKVSDPIFFSGLDFLMKEIKKGNVETFEDSQRNIIQYNDLWEKLQKDLRFLKEERYNLIDKKYGTTESVIKKRLCRQVSLVSHHFLSGLWKDIYNDALDELKRARSKPNFSIFKTYVIGEFGNIINSTYNIMIEYANSKDEMLTTLHSQKCGNTIQGISPTVNWEKIEMVYGNIYEKYADLLPIVAGINNLNLRGDYKVFSTTGFTFDKYLLTDKANRCDNFISNPKLQKLSEFYNSNIRNGTHHRNFTIDKEKQEIIFGVGKGGTRELRMSFVEYISYCNELYARLLILINLAFKVIF